MMKKVCLPSICALTVLSSASDALSQSANLEIDCDSTAEFVVIDASGRQTGFDVLTDQRLNQIPHSTYSYEAIEDEDRTYPTFEIDPKYAPQEGIYLIRIIGVTYGNLSAGYNIIRAGQASHRYLNAPTAPGKVTYLQLTFSGDSSAPLSFALVPPTMQISGGIVNPEGTMNISVRAKPSTTFSNATLETGVATLRWPVNSGATLGTVTSNYGYAKWDTLIVAGGYNYQKIRSTSGAHIAKWNGNTEYELFWIPVSGTNGPVTIDLVNSIPGGEWFVDLNYSDKSDTTFYRQSANVPLPNQGGQKPIK